MAIVWRHMFDLTYTAPAFLLESLSDIHAKNILSGRLGLGEEGMLDM